MPRTRQSDRRGSSGAGRRDAGARRRPDGAARRTLSPLPAISCAGPGAGHAGAGTGSGRTVRPRRAHTGYPPIADHGMAGDLQTAALVSADGTIDWRSEDRAAVLRGPGTDLHVQVTAPAVLHAAGKEADDFRHRLRGRIEAGGAPSGAPLQIEHLIDHLEGYAGSSPVRAGDAAADQVQLDSYGEAADAPALFTPATVGVPASSLAAERLAGRRPQRILMGPTAAVFLPRKPPPGAAAGRRSCPV